jgi:hypothetical protein
LALVSTVAVFMARVSVEAGVDRDGAAVGAAQPGADQARDGVDLVGAGVALVGDGAHLWLSAQALVWALPELAGGGVLGGMIPAYASGRSGPGGTGAWYRLTSAGETSNLIAYQTEAYSCPWWAQEYVHALAFEGRIA